MLLFLCVAEDLNVVANVTITLHAVSNILKLSTSVFLFCVFGKRHKLDNFNKDTSQLLIERTCYFHKHKIQPIILSVLTYHNQVNPQILMQLFRHYLVHQLYHSLHYFLCVTESLEE